MLLADGKQDKVATSTTLYLSAVLLVAMASFLPVSWLSLMFVCEACTYVALAYCLDAGPPHRFSYLDEAAPKSGKVVLLCIGGSLIARWRQAGAFLSVLSTRHFVVIAAESVLIGGYLIYILVRRRPRVQRVFAFLYASACVSLAASTYAYLARNQRYAHTREEYRLGAAALAHLMYVLCLYPGTRYLPTWILHVIVLFSWMLLWFCAGHQFFIRI